MRVISRNLTAWSAGLIVVAVFVSAWLSHPLHRIAGFAVNPAPVGTESLPPKASYSSRFASSDLDDFVHSSAVAGSREGAGDVEIRTSRFRAGAGDPPIDQTGTGKYIRKLGNPVIALAPDNRLWLFYAVGGWAGSSVNAMVSSDMGASWSPPRQLVTSPFLNISTLVRGAPVFHADGSIGLPVYHEFLGKFAEYLYLSANGEVIDKFRISRGKNSLQPTVVPLDEQRGVALLRYAGETFHRVLASRTEDGGQTWSEPYPLTPSNPNSSLAAVGVPGKGWPLQTQPVQHRRTDDGLAAAAGSGQIPRSAGHPVFSGSVQGSDRRGLSCVQWGTSPADGSGVSEQSGSACLFVRRL